MTTAVISQEWRLRAACRDRPDADNLFFPKREGVVAVRAARRVCQPCPVRKQCLEFVLELEAQLDADRYGIFAGFSGAERDQIHRCRTGQCEHRHHHSRRKEA